MSQVSEIIKSFRESKGWNKSEIARELGISSQLYGQYEAGKKPGADFFIAWKRTFGQDLTETIVSQETVDYHQIHELEILLALITTTLKISEKDISDRLQVEESCFETYRKENRVPADFLHHIRTVFRDALGVNNSSTQSDLYLLQRRLLKNKDSVEGTAIYESSPAYATFKPVYHDDPDHQVPDYVLKIPQFKHCNYGTRASGDSMYPEIRNGDLVICQELSIDARIIFGDIYIVHTKDGLETIKYIHQFIDDSADRPFVLLVPHNKAAGMGTPMPRDEIVKLFKVRAIFKAY